MATWNWSKLNEPYLTALPNDHVSQRTSISIPHVALTFAGWTRTYASNFGLPGSPPIPSINTQKLLSGWYQLCSMLDSLIRERRWMRFNSTLRGPVDRPQILEYSHALEL